MEQQSTLKARESIGPFKAVGLALSTIGTVTVVADNTLKVSGEILTTTLGGVNTVVTDGVTALRMTTSNMIKDMETDNIIETAHREVRKQLALAEAARIIAGIPKPNTTK